MNRCVKLFVLALGAVAVAVAGAGGASAAAPAGRYAPPVRAPGSGPPAGVWPLSPRPVVVRGFEPPPEPWLPGHRGVDLLGSPGQRVRAAAAGTVTFAGVLAGRGVVVVSHGATRTTYEPVLASVRAGARVAAGAAIGTLSGAGGHCPPHACLHWGLRRGDVYVDPLTLVSATPVRLLPLREGRAGPVSPVERPPGSLHSGRTSYGGQASVEPAVVEPAPVARSPAPRGGSSVGSAAVVALGGLAVGAGVLVRRH